MKILSMRLPTCREYDELVDITGGSNGIMHWEKMFSWCKNGNPGDSSPRAGRGYSSALNWFGFEAMYRSVDVGFRPAFDKPNSNISDGTLTTVGTLYMDGKPVKIPQNPTRDGDVLDYIPGAKLKFRKALNDAAYQVKAIKIGDVLIADRVLLRSISWNDLNEEEIVEALTSKPNLSSKEMQTFKKLFGKYCQQETARGHCEPDACALCPVNLAYTEIFERFI